MPNHITNIIAVSGDESRIQAMLKAIQTDEYGLGSVDFNKIIHMPDDADSYNWCIANWGSKWNSYGYTADSGFKYGKLTFLTAWSAPHPILQRLSEMYPDIEFEHEWADEDIGMNCGRYVYYDGERTEEYYPESNKERIEFAARVMDSDPSEWCLYLNASDTDYVNFSDEEFEVIEIEGQTALFTNSRMTDADIPKGLHCYHAGQLYTRSYGEFYRLNKRYGRRNGTFGHRCAVFRCVAVQPFFHNFIWLLHHKSGVCEHQEGRYFNVSDRCRKPVYVQRSEGLYRRILRLVQTSDSHLSDGVFADYNFVRWTADLHSARASCCGDMSCGKRSPKNRPDVRT